MVHRAELVGAIFPELPCQVFSEDRNGDEVSSEAARLVADSLEFALGTGKGCIRAGSYMDALISRR